MTGALLLLAAALSAGNADFDRTAAEGAARIAFARAREALVQAGPAAGALAQAMLGDPARFKSPAEAEAACRALYDAAAERQYQEACADIRRALALEESFAVAFSEEEGRALAAGYPAFFAAERAQAVAAQKKALVSATRPTEAEFDRKDEPTLRREMTARVLAEQKAPVFEENVVYISEAIVDPVLKRARDARKRQRAFLADARSSAFAPSRLAADLKAQLEADVAERGRKDGADAWGVFPSVLAEDLPRAVERRALDRYARRMEAAEVAVDAESILKEIVETPLPHVKAAASERIFAKRYAEALVVRALDDACGDAPPDERDELRAYLAPRLAGEGVQKAAAAKVRKDVLPKWRAARAAAAKRQADETWPTLADGTWFPPPALADDVAARSDYAKSVGLWRALAPLKALADAPGGRPLMEEADRRADAEVAAAFDVARSAINAQNAVVDGCHAQVLAEARRRKDSFWTRTPDLKAIVGLLTQATEQAWDAARLDTLWPDAEKRPANADVQHRELFPSVRRRIELLARTILEEMNEPQPENEKKPEEPPQETPDEEPPPEEQPELEFTLSVVRRGDAVELKLLQGERSVYEKTLGAQFAPFGAAMKEVADKLGHDLLKLK